MVFLVSYVSQLQMVLDELFLKKDIDLRPEKKVEIQDGYSNCKSTQLDFKVVSAKK